MIFEIELVATANRAAAVGGGVGGGVEGALYPPQPTKSIGTIKMKTEHAIFLTDIPILLGLN
jgi:hypothetical protein